MRARRTPTSKIPHAGISPSPAANGAADERRAKIAQAAYLLAETRHFAPGHEVQDWLAAEASVDGELAEPPPPKPRKASRAASAKPKTKAPRRKAQAPEE
jgi:hypothetical protein